MPCGRRRSCRHRAINALDVLALDVLPCGLICRRNALDGMTRLHVAACVVQLGFRLAVLESDAVAQSQFELIRGHCGLVSRFSKLGAALRVAGFGPSPSRSLPSIST